MAHHALAPTVLTPTFYTDLHGRPRELVIRPGAHGSLLVLDRDPVTLCDGRLVAHIPSDEPPENAALVSRMYAQERGARLCRQLSLEDLQDAPLPSPAEQHREAGVMSEPLLRGGVLYAIRPHRATPGANAPQLRWSSRPTGSRGRWRALTLREVLAAFESYEPMRSLTVSAVTQSLREQELSVGALRRELERVQRSAFVLNRGLREAVLEAVERRGVSMGEIALRCGMVKRESGRRIGGDTSWLARRIGLIAEGGRRRPTRWVHSNVLAHISRRGLGISPREVELG